MSQPLENCFKSAIVNVFKGQGKIYDYLADGDLNREKVEIKHKKKKKPMRIWEF